MLMTIPLCAPDPPLPATPHDLAAVQRLQMMAAPRSPKQDKKSDTSPPRPSIIRGKAPNIHWRAISSDEFRAHPRVIGLPPVSGLALAGPATYDWVRQDDPLWDELHEGVLTSRHLLSALGMRENKAAAMCGLPRGVVQPGSIARCWEGLRNAAPPPAQLTWCSSEYVAAAEVSNEAYRDAFVAYQRASTSPTWPPSADGATGGYSDDMLSASARAYGRSGINAVRCAWGSAQEAAALVAALQGLPKTAELFEVGMAMAAPDALPNEAMRHAMEAGEIPPLGASPDAMLRLGPKAPFEAVEVKNVCPFFELPASESPRRPRFGVVCKYLPLAHRDSLPFWQLKAPHDSLPVQYVPQVQVEMLCTRTNRCTFISASATQGVNIIKVERDDAYLAELLHFLRVFWTSPCPPSDEIFWAADQDAGGGRYQRFLERTKELGEATRVDRHITRPWRRDAAGAGRRFFLDG